MKKVDILILSWHQVYMTGYAGGYIRLREFIKNVPSNLSYLIIDNKPSIYNDLVGISRIIEYDSPWIIRIFRRYFFLLWLLFETISSLFILYHRTKQVIEKFSPKVIYVPIGEFLQLYIPAILLKRKFPKIRLVIDILNYGIPEKKKIPFYKKLKKDGINIFRAVIIELIGTIGYQIIHRTIRNIDFIFTVSPQLVDAISIDYKKESIDYTPSGVHVDKNKKFNYSKKKYLGVYVGRLTVKKGVFAVLATWRKVIKKNPKAMLALVGFADELTKKVLAETIEQLGITNNVECFYSVDERKKNELLYESELFLHLATFEPLFPVIGILEGFACGLPAIVFDMPVLIKYKKDSELNDFLYIAKSGNIEEVSKKILLFANLSLEKKEKIYLLARKYAKQFDWSQIAKKEFKILAKFAHNE